MSRLTRDGTAEPVSRDQILRQLRRQGKKAISPFLADHEQDWQPYPVDPYSAISDDHTYIHTYHYTYIHTSRRRVSKRLVGKIDCYVTQKFYGVPYVWPSLTAEYGSTGYGCQSCS